VSPRTAASSRSVVHAILRLLLPRLHDQNRERTVHELGCVHDSNQYPTASACQALRDSSTVHRLNSAQPRKGHRGDHRTTAGEAASEMKTAAAPVPSAGTTQTSDVVASDPGRDRP
jgi:hypothetical protein